jgi:hypothetical protein
MTCVYDSTLQDDCVTPIGSSTLLAQVNAAQSDSNPVSSGMASSSGGTSLSAIIGPLLNFGAVVTKAVTGPTQQSGLILQVNPATGLQQYYNPSTGQYVGAPVQTSSIFGGGSSGILLLFVALTIGFLAFGGMRRREA